MDGRTPRAHVDGAGGRRPTAVHRSALQLVIALTAGNYGMEDLWIPPTRVLREIVLASVP
jgi:hypothetical protein